MCYPWVKLNQPSRNRAQYSRVFPCPLRGIGIQSSHLYSPSTPTYISPLMFSISPLLPCIVFRLPTYPLYSLVSSLYSPHIPSTPLYRPCTPIYPCAFYKYPLLPCIVLLLPYISVPFYIYPLLPCIVFILPHIPVHLYIYPLLPCIVFVLPYIPVPFTYVLYTLVLSLYSYSGALRARSPRAK